MSHPAGAETVAPSPDVLAKQALAETEALYADASEILATGDLQTIGSGTQVRVASWEGTDGRTWTLRQRAEAFTTISIFRSELQEQKDGSMKLVTVNAEGVGTQSYPTDGYGISFTAGGFMRGLTIKEVARQAAILRGEEVAPLPEARTAPYWTATVAASGLAKWIQWAKEWGSRIPKPAFKWPHPEIRATLLAAKHLREY